MSKKPKQEQQQDMRPERYELRYPTLSRRAVVKNKDLVSEKLRQASQQIQRILKK